MDKQKKHFFLKYVLLLITANLAVAGCSFKKNPYEQNKQQNHLESAEVKIVSRSIEDIISQDNEAKAISELENIKIENINSIRTKAGSLLDTALILKRKATINLLVMKGLSPFLISDDSYKLVNSDSTLIQFISELQIDRFSAILDKFPDTEGEEQITDDLGVEILGASYPAFDQAILDAHLGAVGCQKFASLLMNLKYNIPDPYLPGTYTSLSLNEASRTKAFKHLIEKSECSQYNSNLSVQSISEWVREEFLSQYRKNFPSTAFINFLQKIATPKSMNIVFYNLSDLEMSTHVSTNPFAVLMLKSSCIHQVRLEKWVTLLRPLIKGPDVNKIGYSFPSEDDIGSCFNGYSNYCLGSPNNKSSVLSLFKLVISSDEKLLNEYEMHLDSKVDGRKPVPLSSELEEKLCRMKPIRNSDDMEEFESANADEPIAQEAYEE